MAKAVYYGISDVARKVKKMYYGVNGVARRVKKGYIGVNGVARLFYSGQGTPGVGPSIDMTAFYCGDDGHRAATMKKYAVFAGAGGNNNWWNQIGAFDSSLTAIVPAVMGAARFEHAGATTGDDHVIFAGGSNTSGEGNPNADAYDSSLTKISLLSLHATVWNAYQEIAGARAGDYALFAGGKDRNHSYVNGGTVGSSFDSSLTRANLVPDSSNGWWGMCGVTTPDGKGMFGGGRYANRYGSTYCTATVHVYDSSLTKTTVQLSQARYRMGATAVGGYTLFGGGVSADGDTSYSNVDAFNISLTRTNPTALVRNAKSYPLATTLSGEIAIFGVNRRGNDGYNSDLTYISMPSLRSDSSGNTYNGGAASVGDYAIFRGGGSWSYWTYAYQMTY